MTESALIVAGEASADAHGASVVAALRRARPQLQLFGVGGAGMRAAGFEALIGAETMALAGLTEVLWALPRMWRCLRLLEYQAALRRPKVALLIDLPDFNLRLAHRLRRLGIAVVYYISPQVWAWRQRRVHEIRRVVDEMLVILPFEQRFYERHGVPVRFVGHPLVEQMPQHPDRAAARRALGVADDAQVVALLPGSRAKEVARHLPAMLAGLQQLAGENPSVRGLLPVANTLSPERIAATVARSGAPVTVVAGGATSVMTAADAAVVCSGTATLQAALLRLPMVVVYRVSTLTYCILKRLVRVAHIALVNLIAGERLVPELVQDALTPQNIARELSALLTDVPRRSRLQARFATLRSELGGPDTTGEVVSTLLHHFEKRFTPRGTP